MNILLFGATGMVGDGVLRWLIASAQVDRVVAVSRKALSVQHAKLQTVIESDMFRLQNLCAPWLRRLLLLPGRKLCPDEPRGLPPPDIRFDARSCASAFARKSAHGIRVHFR
jgi:hypothetical protein